MATKRYVRVLESDESVARVSDTKAEWKDVEALIDGRIPEEAGLGNVVGPASATDGHLAVFDGPTGKLLKGGGAGGGGVTNSAGANVFPLSDGTNLVPSPLRVSGGGVIFHEPVASNADIDLTAPAGFDATYYALTEAGGVASLEFDTPDGKFGIYAQDDGKVEIRALSGLGGMRLEAGAAIIDLDFVTSVIGLGDINDGATKTKVLVNVDGSTIQLRVGDEDPVQIDLDHTAQTLSLTATKGININSVAKLAPLAFASLPASPVEGMMAWVNDSNTATWGATVAGGGADKVLAVYNGTNWTVAGK